MSINTRKNGPMNSLSRLFFNMPMSLSFYIMDNLMLHKINSAVLLPACKHAIKRIEQ